MSAILQNPLSALESVIDIALQAGDLVTSMRDSGLSNIRRKSSSIDIVTEADVAAEKLIREGLSIIGADIGFWGEESNQQPNERTFWVVDPIDGTSNFAMGLPYYAVNIALQEGPQALLGVTVELPALRVYWTVAGEGAHCRYPNGSERKLSVTLATELNEVFLTTGFPYHRAEHDDNNILEHNYFLPRAQGVRCLGASALDFAYVAAGVLGGYWEGWLKPWDATAGALMVREAGGRVSNYNGEEWAIGNQSAIASNGQPGIHEAMVEGIRISRQGLEESLL